MHLFAPSNPASEALTHLFAGDILQVLLHHDLPQAGFDLTLCQLSFCRSAETPIQWKTFQLLSLFQYMTCHSHQTAHYTEFFPSRFWLWYPNLRIGRYWLLIWCQRIKNNSLHTPSLDFSLFNIAECRCFASSVGSFCSSSPLLKIEVASGSTAPLPEWQWKIVLWYVTSVRAKWAELTISRLINNTVSDRCTDWRTCWYQYQHFLCCFDTDTSIGTTLIWRAHKVPVCTT